MSANWKPNPLCGWFYGFDVNKIIRIIPPKQMIEMWKFGVKNQPKIHFILNSQEVYCSYANACTLDISNHFDELN